jgi:hypothetical protein
MHICYNWKWFQSSSKHHILPITPLHLLAFRLLHRATLPANRPTSSHYTLQTWKLVLGPYHAYSYTYLSELQVVSYFFQAPAPPYHSTSLTCVLTTQRATLPANPPTSSHYTPQTWKLVLGRYHTYSYAYML